MLYVISRLSSLSQYKFSTAYERSLTNCGYLFSNVLHIFPSNNIYELVLVSLWTQCILVDLYSQNFEIWKRKIDKNHLKTTIVVNCIIYFLFQYDNWNQYNEFMRVNLNCMKKRTKEETILKWKWLWFIPVLLISF